MKRELKHGEGHSAGHKQRNSSPPRSHNSKEGENPKSFRFYLWAPWHLLGFIQDVRRA
jgi:hypothetical protein